jgi:tetratricopeptide (TPR) repeat protein
MESYQDLEKMIKDESYYLAADLCLKAIQRNLDPRFWKTQLGYVHFLNERDIEAYYNKAPSVFMSLAEEYPHDDNIHFWLGYIYHITLHDSDKAQLELRKTLELNPRHPYANLVLAGLVESDRSVALLQMTLQVQPYNFRAMHQLALLYMSNDKLHEAESLLKSMIDNRAYIEQGYGIMNLYINEVLTGAANEKGLQREAREQLGIE